MQSNLRDPGIVGSEGVRILEIKYLRCISRIYNIVIAPSSLLILLW